MAEPQSWISCSERERMPEGYDTVLVVLHHQREGFGNEVLLGGYCDGVGWQVSGGNYWGSAKEEMATVTHWMPLLEPPK